MIELRSDQEWEIRTERTSTLLPVLEVYLGIRAGAIMDWHRCRRPGDGPWKVINTVFLLLSGRYGLLKGLGEGTFGRVYMALDLKDSVTVAVKRPQPTLVDPERSLTRIFVKEALNAAYLATEPNVVKVLDVDTEEPYIVLTYCNQGSLSQRMKQPYTTTDVIRWCHQIARPLASAHALRPNYVVHHDLKPDNVLFSDDVLMLSDFGGAMFIRDSESLKSLKPYGFTPVYAAPEAFDAESGNPPAIDVWALGVILWQLLSGELPFPGGFNLIDLEKKIRDSSLPVPMPIRPELTGTVSPILVSLAYQCLEKNPGNRPTSKQCADILATLKG